MRNNYLFALLLCLVLVSGLNLFGKEVYAGSPCPVTSGWCYLSNYVHWFNVSSVNWTYSNANGQAQNAQWVFLKFNTSYLGQIEQVNIQGYNNQNVNLGYVKFILLENGPFNTSILVSRYAQKGAWSYISVFYHPTSNIQGIGLISMNYSCEFGGYTSPSGSQVQCNPLYGAQNFVVYVNTSSVPGSKGGFATGDVAFPSIYSTSHYSQVNFTSFGPFVVITNRNMTNRYFNITYSSGFANQYVVNSTGTKYKLYSIGTTNRNGVFVSNSSSYSSPSNELFGTSGYEGFFSTSANYVLTEGMGTKTCLLSATCLYNSSISSVFTQSTLPQTIGSFNIKVDTSLPTTYYIIPAFSSNYIIRNGAQPYTNPHPIVNCTGLCNTTLEGWYYDFTNRTLIYGINWSYNFETLAYPQNIGRLHNISFGAGTVGYLTMTLKHYTNFGLACQDMYVNAFINGSSAYTPIPGDSNESLGAIDFFPINCSSDLTKNITILLSNRTELGYTYNSFYLYTDSPYFNDSGATLSDYGIVSSYEIAKTNHTRVIDSTNVPYLITLDNILNPNSIISIHNYPDPTNASYGYMGYSGVQFIKDCHTISFGANACGNIAGETNVSATSQVLTTKFLVYNSINAGISVKNFFGYNLGMFSNQTQAGQPVPTVSNATNSMTLFSDAQYSEPNQYTNIALFNNNATVTHLATSIFKQGPTQHIPQAGEKCTVFCGSSLPVSTAFNHNQTSKLNFTNTTTIGFNGINNSPNLVLAPGVAIPEYLLYIFAIIFIIFGATSFDDTEHGDYPFALILIGIWFIGFTQWIILIFATLMTAMFIIYEFTNKKQVQKVQQVVRK